MDKIKKTLNNLKRNGFAVEYFPSKQSAAKWLAEQLPAKSVAAFGGSVTLSQIGLARLLADKDIDILDYWQVAPEQRREIFLSSLNADGYFCSANAIIEDGSYLNVDGAGNRTASTIYGPKKLYIVAGVNKIVKDIDEAYDRAKIIAPLNCKRMSLSTPCAASGICQDCDSPARACRVFVLTKRPARTVETTIVLINEDLGY